MKIIKWFFVVIGILGLISVRIFEDKIFYDPFLNFFHDANINEAFPNFIWGKLIINYLFRFLSSFFNKINVKGLV